MNFLNKNDTRIDLSARKLDSKNIDMWGDRI